MIEYFIVFAIALGFAVLGMLGNKWLEIKRDAVKFNRSKMAAVRAAKKSAASGAPSEHPAWLTELIETLGADTSILDNDEMPELLEQFLPTIQGFLDGGGLDKLKKGAPPAEEFVGY